MPGHRSLRMLQISGDVRLWSTECVPIWFNLVHLFSTKFGNGRVLDLTNAHITLTEVTWRWGAAFTPSYISLATLRYKLRSYHQWVRPYRNHTGTQITNSWLKIASILIPSCSITFFVEETWMFWVLNLCQRVMRGLPWTLANLSWKGFSLYKSLLPGICRLQDDQEPKARRGIYAAPLMRG